MVTVLRHRSTLAVGALALALIAAGCAGRVDQTAPTSPPPSTSAPTSEPVELTGLEEPAPIFGGDCSLLFSDDDMTEIAGAGTKRQLSTDSDEDGVEDNVGGLNRELGIIDCSWANTDVNIRLKAYWDDLDLGVEERTCGRYEWGEAALNTDLCLVDAESHGVRIAGVVVTANKRKSQQIAGHLLDSFESTDRSDAAGEPRQRASGSWDSRKLCEQIGPIDIEGEAVSLITDIPGTDAGALPVEDALDSLYPPRGCYSENRDSTPPFDFEFIPGGAWAFDVAVIQQAMSSAQKFGDSSHDYQGVIVPGFETAAFTVGEYGTTYILVSGPNFLRVNASERADETAVLTAIGERLDEVNGS